MRLSILRLSVNASTEETRYARVSNCVYGQNRTTNRKCNCLFISGTIAHDWNDSLHRSLFTHTHARREPIWMGDGVWCVCVDVIY